MPPTSCSPTGPGAGESPGPVPFPARRSLNPDERSVIPVLAHVTDGGGPRLVGRPGVPLEVETNRAPAARQRRVAAAGQEEGVGQRVGRLGHAGEGQREPMWVAHEAPLWGGATGASVPVREGGR